MNNSKTESVQPSPMVESQAMVVDNATGPSEAGKNNLNPFQNNQRTARSPMRMRSHSLADNIKITQKQAVLTAVPNQRDIIPNKIPVLYDGSFEVNQLKNELQAARDEIRELKKIIESANFRKTYSPANSDGEEELVAKETEWLLPKRKKRKAMFSPEIKENSPKTIIKPNPNSFKKHKPPPVVVSNLDNYNGLNDSLKSRRIKYSNNLMNNKQLKINVETENDYRELTKFMNDAHLEWHTYENKQTRPIRVMARNLHPSCNTKEIKEDLIAQGFKILDVTNKIKKTKVDDKILTTPLPLFILTFDNKEDIKKIFEIQYICHLKVKIEALRSGQLIPQCKRCQRFGHTQKFCQRAVKCVKCAGNHLTAECKKLGNSPPKCSNCGEAHPANYRGCLVAKELQSRRKNLVKDKITQNTQQPRQFISREKTNELSYAQATEMKQNRQINQQVTEEQTMIQMLQNILSRLERLEARNTGAVPRNNKQWI